MEMNSDPELEQSENEILRMIEKVPIFAGLSPPEQRVIARRFKLATAQTDEIIIEQGDRSNQLYIIVRGQVLVSKKKESGEWAKVKVLRIGDFFGEIAILRKIPRTARVSSLSNCLLLTIEAQDFLEIYQYLPAHSQYNIQMVVKKRLEELSFI